MWHASRMERPSGSTDRMASRVLAAAFLAAGVAQAAFFAACVKPGLFPDERAHVSYLRDVAAREAFVPSYEEMRLLEADGRFGVEKNYLSHPPFGYRLLALLEKTAGFPSAPGLAGAIRSARRASLLLLGAALAAALWIVARGPLPAPFVALFGASLIAVPMVFFEGANPDLLALLGGALASAGALRATGGRVDAAAGMLLGTGSALAAAAKLTGGLLLVPVLAVVVTRVLRGVRAGRRPSRAFLAASLLPLVLPAAFWAAVTVRYGTPVPSLKTTDPAAYAASPWPSPSIRRLSPAEWTVRSARLLDVSGRGVASHVAVPSPGPLSWPLRLLPIAAIAGLLVPARGEGGAGEALVLRAAAGTALAVLVINVAVTWREHVASGTMGGIQARYYFPLLPLFLLAAVRGVAALPSRAGSRIVAWGGAVLLLVGEAALLVRGRALGVF